MNTSKISSDLIKILPRYCTRSYFNKNTGKIFFKILSRSWKVLAKNLAKKHYKILLSLRLFDIIRSCKETL